MSWEENLNILEKNDIEGPVLAAFAQAISCGGREWSTQAVTIFLWKSRKFRLAKAVRLV